MPYLKRKRRNDKEVWRLYQVAIAEGIPASVVGGDGRLYDMHGWAGDVIKAELLGMRWLEYVEPEDLPRVLRWLKHGRNGTAIYYRGVCPGNHACQCALCKLNGETLHLLTGASIASEALLPAPDCLAEALPPPDKRINT
jgi:hypothetical protein